MTTYRVITPRHRPGAAAVHDYHCPSTSADRIPNGHVMLGVQCTRVHLAARAAETAEAWTRRAPAEVIICPCIPEVA